jgi:hypothetical protein
VDRFAARPLPNLGEAICDQIRSAQTYCVLQKAHASKVAFQGPISLADKADAAIGLSYTLSRISAGRATVFPVKRFLAAMGLRLAGWR